MSSASAQYASLLSLSLSQAESSDVLEFLLDRETGFCVRMQGILSDLISAAQSDLNIMPTPSALERIQLMKMESDTWALIQLLLGDRMMAQEETEKVAVGGVSQVAKTHEIIQSSEILRELVDVRDWVMDCAAADWESTYAPAASETTGYHRFTRALVLQDQRTNKKSSNTVSTLDPDASSHQKGKSIAPDDLKSDQTLLHTLFGLVRCGKTEEAVDICRSAHQPWRAASLNGQILFTWSREEEQIAEDAESYRGNLTRSLWRKICTKVALDPTLPPAERLLYASLVPSPQVNHILFENTTTYHDQIWYTVCTLIEERISERLARLPPSESAIGWGDEDGDEELGPSKDDMDQDKDDEEEWEADVTSTLEGLQSREVKEGPEASHPFHVIQMHVIMNRLNELLDDYANNMPSHIILDDERFIHLTRFFTHLSLFLRLLGNNVPSEAVRRVLEGYLGLLEASSQTPLIALYAKALGENAIERYAEYLVGLGVRSSIVERKEDLARAKEQNLDVVSVAVRTAELSLQKAFNDLPSLRDLPLPDLLRRHHEPNEMEEFLLRSIEWTIFEEETYPVALEQACCALRYFLASGRLSLAERLMSLLPSSLALITPTPPSHSSYNTTEAQVAEYQDYIAFFNLLSLHQSYQSTFALLHSSNPLSNSARRSIIDDLTDASKKIYEKTHSMLCEREWLVGDMEDESGDKLQRELVRVRSIWVPEIIIRLHGVLVSSSEVLPENLRSAIEFTNIVADARYKLYEDFAAGGRLKDYLSGIRTAVLKSLEDGGNDPFAIVRSKNL